MIEHKVVDAPHPLLIENNRLRAKNTYQQVEKNESGTNRIAASRLQQISHILQAPVAFFFEGAPKASAPHGSHGRYRLPRLITSSPIQTA